MNWNTCFSNANLGRNEKKQDLRSSFQKDYDRIIFSSSFRRLQNKTQVFPLPGTTFVHNRLTHSLEVASVGRSLGEIVGQQIIQECPDLNDSAKRFYSRDLSSVISSACLAHDIGNPAFGHSGEDALSNYFVENAAYEIEGNALRSLYSDDEWEDLIHFEGNANAIRVLTQHFQGKSEYGLGITLTTLASLLKYPCASSEVDKRLKHRKKYGYFQSEKNIFLNIVQGNGMLLDENKSSYRRHPFVYLVEAADDICYNIIDMEDAHRIGLLSKDVVSKALLDLIRMLDVSEVSIDHVVKTYHSISDENESIGYLRAKCINAVVIAASSEFLLHKDDILTGQFNSSLLGEIGNRTKALDHIQDVSLHKIYRHPSVLEIEVAGFKVMSALLEIFLPSVLKEKKTSLDKSILELIPNQFKMHIDSTSYYLRTMNVLDHISSMTDAYAIELYRKLSGIEL